MSMIIGLIMKEWLMVKNNCEDYNNEPHIKTCYLFPSAFLTICHTAFSLKLMTILKDANLKNSIYWKV